MSTGILADEFLREWLKPAYRRVDKGNWLGNQIALSRKFSLDDNTSAFIADLGDAQITSCAAHRRVELVEATRKLSRLPHALTWIEYSNYHRVKRAREVYKVPGWQDIVGKQMIPSHGRSGWLCIQYPTDPLAFMAITISNTIVLPDRSDWRDLCAPSMIAFQWRVDDNSEMAWPLPTLLDPVGIFEHGDHKSRKLPWSTNIVGMRGYEKPFTSYTKPPFLSEAHFRYALRHDRSMLIAVAGEARYLWALLATINDLPVHIEGVKPDRGFLAKGGRYRKFCEHRVITLTIPETRYRQIARRVLAIARRKRHGVRGHWREDWRHALAVFCEHDFVVGEEHLDCKICKGRKVWIKEHERGDSSLGFVLHDYQVQRAEGEQI